MYIGLFKDVGWTVNWVTELKTNTSFLYTFLNNFKEQMSLIFIAYYYIFVNLVLVILLFLWLFNTVKWHNNWHLFNEIHVKYF